MSTEFKFKHGDIVSTSDETHPKAGYPLRVVNVEHVQFTHLDGHEVDFVSVAAVPLSNHPQFALHMSEDGFRHRPDLVASLHPSWLIQGEDNQ